MLWYNDPELRRDLDGMLAPLWKSPEQMSDWLFSAVFEGARQVLASVRAHHPGMDLGPPVWVVPSDWSPETLFEEVRDDAKFAAGACELQTIIKRAARDVDGSL